MPLPEEALSSTQDCLFLTRLPLKIRYDIYELLVRAAPHQPDVYATITYLRKFHREGLKHIEDYQPESVLAISRTCRQIRHESFTIYYGSNTFSFSNTLYAYLYLSFIGPQRRAYVSSIQFMWAIYNGQARAMRLLDVTDLLVRRLVDCVSLRKLHIAVAKESRDGTSMKYPPSDLFLLDATPSLKAALRGRGDIEIKVREVFEWGGRDKTV
ncbi:uncharacterized protein PAC_18183 [Phialocephala subalpina]|uniref:DUF7730 domain-containing protein n=1 Tax=Phialocephala subalpina TaxID=576137 RepID=A0A1L7XTC2_9HELO|nr:uncharacterized protein PAC_18183 [Phialocephala subalpina]